MKPFNLFHLLLAAPLLFMLAGCPMPNRYLFNGNRNAPPVRSYTTNQQGHFTIHTVYPWLDTHKKVIVLHGYGTNNTADTLRFILSNNIIYSPTDTFEAINYKGKLVNNYRNEQDTVVLLPGESKDINTYFISRHHYTHRTFRRTNRHDTMQLHLNVFNQRDTVINMVNYHAKSTVFF
jgi:hypothetical protein